MKIDELMEILKPYADKDGNIEVVVRGLFKRIKEMPKINIKELENAGKNDIVDSIVNKLLNSEKVSNINNAVINASNMMKNIDNTVREGKKVADNIFKTVSQMENAIGVIGNLSYVQIGLQCANLCTSAVGFSYMNKKLNAISNGLDSIKKELKDIKEHQELVDKKQCDKIIGDYGYILDLEERGKEIEEKDFHNLANEMHATLNSLISCFIKIESCREKYLDVIFSLLPMYAALLKKYMTAYHFNNIEYNKNILNEDNYLHVFDRIKSLEFSNAVQEYYFLNKSLSSRDSLVASSSAYCMGANFRLDVEDNKKIINMFNDKKTYDNFLHHEDLIIKEILEDSVDEYEGEEKEELEAVLKYLN